MLDHSTEPLTDPKAIKSWLLKAGVPNQKVRFRPNGLVDVMTDVNLRGKLGVATRLPIHFGSVFGTFDCSDNLLTTLTGAPQDCHGRFICSNNRLRSLRGAPVHVHNSVICNNNDLLTLRGLRHVSGVVQCQGNPNLYDVRGSNGFKLNLSSLLDLDQVRANAEIHRPRIRLAKAAGQAAIKRISTPTRVL